MKYVLLLRRDISRRKTRSAVARRRTCVIIRNDRQDLKIIAETDVRDRSDSAKCNKAITRWRDKLAASEPRSFRSLSLSLFFLSLSFSWTTIFFSRVPSSRDPGVKRRFLSFSLSPSPSFSISPRVYTSSASSHSHMSTVVCSGNHPLRRSAVFSGSAERARQSAESRKAGRITYGEIVISEACDDRRHGEWDSMLPKRERQRKRERENDSFDLNAICK